MLFVSSLKKRWVITIIFLVGSSAWEVSMIHGFLVNNRHLSSNYNFGCRPATSERGGTILNAVKKKSNKNKKKNVTSRTGGGFGSSESSSSSNRMDNKVRSVTGHTGSGTKPLRVAANTFDSLRKAFGSECCNDVYIRSPLNDPSTFWFVGKVARCLCDSTTSDDASAVVMEDDSNSNSNSNAKREGAVVTLRGEQIPTPQEAVISQKKLILEYSKHQLRPQNFGGKYSSSLEVWLAPGDSEMDVVQNKVSLEKVTGSLSDLSDGFHVGDVGFNPEIYVGDEIQQGGLRVQRDEEGKPTKPVFEVNQSA